ncbi:MAG TPA: hypothetical protein VGF77_17795 [Allosphingosinicella sp.]|jgi:hypothetical protein
MPKGYRLFLAAVVGSIVLGIVFGWTLQPAKPHLSGDSGYRKQPVSYRAGGAGCERSKIGELPVRLRQRKADSCADAEEQHRSAANSVIEARRAAGAADASAIAAYQQARVAAWGFGTGVVILFAAISAALFAKAAADHTEAGANETRRIGEAQVRCYLTLKSVKAKIDSQVISWTEIILLNTGQSPARNFLWSSAVSFFTGRLEVAWESAPAKISDSEVAPDIPIGISESFSKMHFGRFLSDGEIDIVRDAENALFNVEIMIRWTDVFGTVFEETHRFQNGVSYPIIDTEIDLIEIFPHPIRKLVD